MEIPIINTFLCKKIKDKSLGTKIRNCIAGNLSKFIIPKNYYKNLINKSTTNIRTKNKITYKRNDSFRYSRLSKEKKNRKTEVNEEKEENKVPIFTGSLFNNDKNNNSNNQGQSSIFDQKLFQNKIEDNNINININLLPENKINSIFENTQNAQETFLKNNISLMNNNSNNNNTEQSSPIFNINIQNNSEINPETLKTLNDKIKEGDIYNADSAKKTQTNPNLNIFSTLNTNISNENAPIPIPSTNKGKNPFKPDEQQNINTTSNNNDNNIDTNYTKRRKRTNLKN